MDKHVCDLGEMKYIHMFIVEILKHSLSSSMHKMYVINSAATIYQYQ